MTNVVHIRKLQTAQQVLDDAATQDLEHVIVLGVRKDGSNYFEANLSATLLVLVWMLFCGNDLVQRMVNGK